MAKVDFRDLPMVVRLSSAVSVMTAWVCFEEFGIDRYGLDAYLPYYRVAQFCPYDAAMLLMIVVGWILLSRPPRGGSTPAP